MSRRYSNIPEDCWYKNNCSSITTQCGNHCIRYSAMKDLCLKSNLPKSKWLPLKLTTQKDRNSYLRLGIIQSGIKEWVQEGNGLYIYSKNYGNGRTSWAVKLLLSYFNSIWYESGYKCRGLFINSADFLMRRKNMITTYDENLA